MTTILEVSLAQKIRTQLPEAVISADANGLLVKADSLDKVAGLLKNDPELSFDYLANISGVDYVDYLEVVYHLVSLRHNHSVVVKTRCHDRNQPVVPSISSLWEGADFQERETYDMFGIRFEGHPNLKRIYLWEGFQGFPLRRDYL